MHFELTREYLDGLKQAIVQDNLQEVDLLMQELHPADIAEVFDELNIDEARYVFLALKKETKADVVIELEEDVRERFLKHLTSEEIALDFIDQLDSDDAADIIGELPEDKQEEVLANIANVEQAGDIVDLLTYDEDTAGGLMAKELIAINENLSVNECLQEIRIQAEEVEEVFFVYVVDDNKTLKGTLPLKKLLLSHKNTRISKICDYDVLSVKAETKSEDVANIMDKYDLVALPVVDSIGRLKGRITIDDVVDVIKEEAEKDYQLISGISSDVESSDSVLQLTKARIPWLLVGLVGGILGAMVVKGSEEQLAVYTAVAMFIPLIAAMGGNVGIQSSAIIVQGLANKSLGFDSTFQKLAKELMVGLTNGFVLSTLLFLFSWLVFRNLPLAVSVSTSLTAVIVFAALFGTFVPLALDKFKIDPALATGPFITTVNDVIGLFLYFVISKGFFQLFA
jgi:magnesium transporter